MKNKIIFLASTVLFLSCTSERSVNAISPIVITEPVEFDTDDPAIWIDEDNPSESLIIGTDKEVGGGLYAFDLNGKIQKSITGMNRPNNVDVAYGLQIGGQKVDVAVATERNSHRLRVFSLPDFEELDNGGLSMFRDETNPAFREVMGISIYNDPGNGNIYAITGRKDGPSDNYLEQHLLSDDGAGGVKATLVRKFGKYSGVKEIEAIAVDNELGYVYYSVELFTRGSDGNEVTSKALNDNFPCGLFVAMSEERTFHYYSWSDIAGDDLFCAPDGKIN